VYLTNIQVEVLRLSHDDCYPDSHQGSHYGSYYVLSDGAVVIQRGERISEEYELAAGT
jgi:hypothetical protein